MQTAFWAPVTQPRHSEMALRPDEASDVAVALMIPLALQLRAEEADVNFPLLFGWCCLFAG